MAKIKKPLVKTPQKCADFLFYGDGAISLPILLQAHQELKIIFAPMITFFSRSIRNLMKKT